MNYLPPEKSEPNRRDQTGYDSLIGQMQPNDQVRSWENWIDGFKKEHINCFEWLLKKFCAPSYPAAQQQQVNSLINAIGDPKTFLETFREIYEDVIKLQTNAKKLEDENRSLRSNNNSFHGNNSYLTQENRFF